MSSVFKVCWPRLIKTPENETGSGKRGDVLEIVMTLRASRELRATRRFLVSRRPQSGDDWIADFVSAVHMLRLLPLIGRAGTQAKENFWSLPKWHKVIVYRIEDTRIVILTIRDTRQE
jgi:plasmid stabilization system protein ParE